jgi:hypothetical protein
MEVAVNECRAPDVERLEQLAGTGDEVRGRPRGSLCGVEPPRHVISDPAKRLGRRPPQLRPDPAAIALACASGTVERSRPGSARSSSMARDPGSRRTSRTAPWPPQSSSASGSSSASSSSAVVTLSTVFRVAGATYEQI